MMFILMQIFMYQWAAVSISSAPSAFCEISLRLTPEQLYLVKVGSRTFKVAL